VRINKLLFAAMLCAILAVSASAQQNFLNQTTLTAAIPGQYLGPGSTGNVPAPTFITVASATGMIGINPNLGVTLSQPSQTMLYVDREAMLVQAVNGLQLTVVRGYNGTVATPHSNGAMVLAGSQRFFYTNDPGGQNNATGSIANVPCVLANVVASPWVNIRTGYQWYCNANSLVWTPGFNNPMLPLGASQATVASAAGAVNVGGPVFKVSGALAITSWTFTGNQNIGVAGAATANSQTAQFCIIPTGAFTTTATNNIGVAYAAVVGQESCWQWNGPDAKWYVIQ
jgi:hypothetical protein